MKIDSITNAVKALGERTTSSKEIVEDCLKNIKEKNGQVNALITVCEREALKQAQEAGILLKKRGEKVFGEKPLLGIPFIAKDLYLTKNIKTTAGSKVLENYIGQYDATSILRLKKAGAILIGKSNLDAWGHGSSGENSDFGLTRNPYDLKRTPGGSSSGSAASLASNMALFSTGTDTGGSIRLPASFCNLVGLKPTYGLVSRYGIISLASSLDSIGHFAYSVEDCARVLSITAGEDKLDSTCAPLKKKDFTKFIGKSIKGLRIGIPKEYFTNAIDKRIKSRLQEVIKFYEKNGAEIISVSLPSTQYSLAAYYIIMPSEVSSNLSRFDGIRYANARDKFSLEAKRRILIGTFCLSSGYYDQYYLKAMKVRGLIINDFNKAFKKVDALLTPVSPTMPFKLGEKTKDPVSMYMADVLTTSVSLAGLPALSVPAGFIDKLPVGFQLIGDKFKEEILFQIAHFYEKENK